MGPDSRWDIIKTYQLIIIVSVALFILLLKKVYLSTVAIFKTQKKGKKKEKEKKKVYLLGI